jgi:hypothetical protein
VPPCGLAERQLRVAKKALPTMQLPQRLDSQELLLVVVHKKVCYTVSVLISAYAHDADRRGLYCGTPMHVRSAHCAHYVAGCSNCSEGAVAIGRGQ